MGDRWTSMAVWMVDVGEDDEVDVGVTEEVVE